MQHNNWDIKRALIDSGSSVGILCWNTFQKLQFNPDSIKVFLGLLLGMSGKHVQVRSHITL